MTRLGVVFNAGRGVSRWTERNAESPVPGAWPYGLEQLAAPGVDLTDLEVPELSRFQRAFLDLRLTSSPRRTAPRVDAALCWDESAALQMEAGVRADRLSSGVIWATDAAERGERTRGLSTLRRAFRRMDALWVLAQPQVDRVVDWLGAGHPPVHFVPFGVDTTFYRATPYPQEPVVASVGGDRDRDAETLFEALSLVHAARPQARLIVQSKSSVPAPPGIERHRHIPHNGVRSLLASATVVAIATRHNQHGSGMTVALEAASCARPVVMTMTPGMEDYVRPDITGLTAPVGDAAAIAARIIDLLDDVRTAELMGRRGRNFVEERRSTRTMSEILRGVALDD